MRGRGTPPVGVAVARLNSVCVCVCVCVLPLILRNFKLRQRDTLPFSLTYVSSVLRNFAAKGHFVLQIKVR